MTPRQKILYLYGFYRLPSRDITSTADNALSTFRGAWRDMEAVFKQFENNFESKRKDLQKAEKNLLELRQEVGEEREKRWWIVKSV